MKKFVDLSAEDTEQLISTVQRKLSSILPADTVAVVVLTARTATRNLVITHLPPLESVELLRQAASEVELWAIESN